MKRQINTLALMAIITSTAFAGFNAPLPEFKTPQQLAVWRAELAAKSQASTKATTQDTAFYTGKPYLVSTGSYAFKYRAYNPELARWTSEDPSGFPDGANGNVYAPIPTEEYDSLGLEAQSIHLAMTTSGMKDELWNALQASNDGNKAGTWSAIDLWIRHLSPVYDGQYNWDYDAHTSSITDNGGTAGITGVTGFSAYAETISVTSGHFAPPPNHTTYPGTDILAWHYELQTMFTVTASGAFSGTWNFGKDPNSIDLWHE